MGRNKSKKLELPLKSKLKKDPGVPRLPNLKVKATEKLRAHKTVAGGGTDPDSPMASEPTLSSLAHLAASTSTPEYITDPSSSASAQQRLKEQLRRHYVRTLHKVIDESDIVILVLDARDPEGCRSRLVEEEVRRRESEGKKLIFVLNKIDLIPRENAQEWLRYLRHSTPTLPFRSASSNQRSNLSSTTAPALVRLLKAYKPSAQSVTVGVVGYPNVGKSSLINTLKRAKVCAVAAQPGHTKELQTVQLERGIKIVDSPGVVFDDDDFDVNGKGGKKESILLRNAIKVEDIDDPIAVVEQILSRTNHEVLKKIYNLPQIDSTLEFLTMLALTTGRLLKGGTPDILAAGRQVLTDWNHQKIPYMSSPPSIHASSIPSTIQSNGERIIAPGAETVGQAQILTEMAKPFALEGLFGAADAGAFGGSGSEDQDAAMGEDDVIGEDTSNQDAVPMESDEPVTSPESSRKRALSPALTTSDPLPSNLSARQRKLMETDADALRGSKRRKTLETEDVTGHVPDINPLNRKLLKKEAKRARRAANRLAGKSSGMEIDDDGSTFRFTFTI